MEKIKATETAWEKAQMLDLTDKDFKSAIINTIDLWTALVCELYGSTGMWIFFFNK